MIRLCIIALLYFFGSAMGINFEFCSTFSEFQKNILQKLNTVVLGVSLFVSTAVGRKRNGSHMYSSNDECISL
jgi:hypothetical protein